MKIAQITWCSFPNFGTSLQAYALQTILQTLGHESVIIDDKRFTWLNTSPRQILMFWVKGFLRHPKAYANRLRLIRSYKRFNHRYLNIKCGWKTTSDLQNFDAYICGSDQIWSPLLPNHFEGFYFAAFAPKSARRIAYAPSLGSTRYTAEYATLIRPWVSGFKALSARETSGAEILGKISNRSDVKTVIDPTLLLDSSVWQSIVNQQITPPHAQEAYLLVYFLTYNEIYLGRAREYADRHNLKLVMVGTDMKARPYADIFLDCANPLDFLCLVAHSHSVITDSFHGTIFSIHFHRPFLTVKRFRDDAANNQNSRVENLFDLLGIEDNFLSEEDLISAPIVIPSRPTDAVIEEKLRSLRDESLTYLKNALS